MDMESREMNKSVREEIEKAARETMCRYGGYSTKAGHELEELQINSFEDGAEFGYNLALKHCQVLREALEDIGMARRGGAVASVYNFREIARKALEQFDKITKEEK